MSVKIPTRDGNRSRNLAFRILYNFIYYFFYLVLLAFLIVTPADLIQQAVAGNQKLNILIVALSYLVTILLVTFIYATRLWMNRSAIASIPKTWIPVEKGDVPRDVRGMIVEGLSRSAAVAWEARPRLPLLLGGGIEEERAEEEGVKVGRRGVWMGKLRRNGEKEAMEEGVGIEVSGRQRAVWGEIEHPGWASPTSPDLPNLQYEAVIGELPNLIEAKALTLAPEDRMLRVEPAVVDAEAVALLQRPESMGLREYLGHLTELAVLAPLPTTGEFLAKYEAARFSTRPVSNEQFRSLMHLFAEVLRNMFPLSAAMLARYGDGDDGSSGHAPTESDIDNDAPDGSSPSSSSSTAAHSVRRSTRGQRTPVRPTTSSTSDSGREPPKLSVTVRTSSANTWQQFRTAPTTPKSRHTGLSRASSTDTFAQTRHPYPISQASSASLRSGTGSEGSVIRLATNEDATDLPYVLRHSTSL
ncbi:hypothetical protein QBC34DRAFT_107835 [Podospora aff. communis PSN243]|uniref:Defect at low temperature protein 1 n=1 Tax=Podospora aff. communis PSN243 TaxID=3040156 RepID=A0AAV9H6I8_9PEZI|nr:hypothetical protein QBC34DRAFT_107835 [Podospora aff. communis PSN243]